MVSKQEFDDLQNRLAQYERQQTELQLAMKNEVSAEVQNIAGGLRGLYEQAAKAVGELQVRLEKVEVKVEASGEGGRKGKSLIHPKNMSPDKLAKQEDWKSWKSDVEDYCEENFPGMKDILERIAKADKGIDESWFDVNEDDWWQRGDMFWRFLKRYTHVGTDARKVVKGGQGG